MKLNKHQKSQLTNFQRRVYDALLEIPRGRVTTYKIIAANLKCRSCRAVGQALKRNPFAPGVPCHRVISSDFTVGGFQGKMSGAPIERKLTLLAKEGIKFKNGKLADPAAVYTW